MKCKVITNSDVEEVVIYTKEYNNTIKEIEEYILNKDIELLGFIDKRVTKLNLADIYCFIVEDNKVYGITKNEKYLIKQRIYVLEEMYNNTFIKAKFETSVIVISIWYFSYSFKSLLLNVISGIMKSTKSPWSVVSSFALFTRVSVATPSSILIDTSFAFL